jgi:hypothetical protein
VVASGTRHRRRSLRGARRRHRSRNDAVATPSTVRARDVSIKGACSARSAQPGSAARARSRQASAARSCATGRRPPVGTGRPRGGSAAMLNAPVSAAPAARASTPRPTTRARAGRLRRARPLPAPAACRPRWFARWRPDRGSVESPTQDVSPRRNRGTGRRDHPAQCRRVSTALRPVAGAVAAGRCR